MTPPRLGSNERRERSSTQSIAAGLITGEALMGIFIAIPIVVTGKGDVLALPANLHFGGWLGLALLAWIAWLLYRFATKPDAQVAAQ